MNDNELFDTNNISDLGENIVSELKLSKMNSGDQQLMELFSIKPQLTIDQIIIGIFRKFGVEKKRGWVTSRLYSLVKKGKLQKVEGINGSYELKTTSDS